MKLRDSKLGYLSTIDVLADLPVRKLRQIRPITTLVVIPAATVLWQEGDTSLEAFMVVDGELELLAGGQSVDTIGPGHLVGGVGVPAAAPRVATAMTVTDVTALVLSRAE